MNTKWKISKESNLRLLLSELQIKPFRISIEKGDAGGADAFVTLAWEGHQERFAAKFRNVRALRELREAIEQARFQAAKTGNYPLVVVPFLNENAFDLLEEKGVSGLDLSGNGYIVVPGQWWFRQTGYPNKYAGRKSSRRIYQGKSALVGRAFLSCPNYSGVNEVGMEILRRGGELSIGQVSKVLKGLEDDLVVVRTSESIQLAQPAKLLDALASGYVRPVPIETVALKAVLDVPLLAELRERCNAKQIDIAGIAPWRYTVAPEVREQLSLYVNAVGFGEVIAGFDVASDPRFANLIVHAVDDSVVFFDLREEDGFRWCSPLQVYLELMQGGKREKEIAAAMRQDILKRASTR